MGLKDSAQQAAKELIYNKATISIENINGVKSSLDKGSKSSSLSRQAANKISQGGSKITSQISKAAETLLQKAGLGKEIPNQDVGLPLKQSDKIISVQYNPATLRISSHLEKIGEGLNNCNEINTHGGASNFDLDVSLVFSSRYPTDNSVHEQVERFLAFMLTSRDRKVTFAWGNHLFQGILNNVNARFLQFERTGNPTYATVDISIEGVPDVLEKKIENLEKGRNNKTIKEKKGVL